MSRWSAVAAHACTLVAVLLWSDVVDARRGHPMHLRVTSSQEPVDPALAHTVAWAAALAALVASLGLIRVHILAPPAVAVALVVGWALARLPAERKYHVIPELLGPLLVLGAPAAVLLLFGDAAPPLPSVIAGAAFLSATVLAAHSRERSLDLANRIPTVATRNLRAARSWLLLLAMIGTIAGVSTITLPLDGAEMVRALGAVGFGASAVFHRAHVPALSVAHAVFALSLLL